ncbi:putative ammonium transporter 1 isoform X2 [Eurytemora carolleeae]|uniref:putative ammonium transporter 1 isoform X2 n=1 Tax=Eurytemora carolleeae TaxID=1294199 RepID=UPI000C789581|nr:putative ammonium transporter 1 isoform X2 [Eurytemora carolleeae]|eukprot:XP_023320857.1 putative ammonium transporter 1 isoform X2 [Eurytemora affinis]
MIGWTYFGLANIPLQLCSHIFFQGTFAATCTTIVSGAVAERVSFPGYILLSIILTGFIYPVQAHWGWSSQGWLKQTEFRDYAGSGLVHLCGGTLAFFGALILGPRAGRFKRGAEGSITNPGDGVAVARSVLNTIISCCIAGQLVLIINRLITGYWSLTKMINGSLTGMVCICAGADRYYPWAASIVAGFAAVFYICCSFLMVKIKIDDPLDAISVHFVGGLWGLIAAPIFMDTGLLYSADEKAVLVLVWNLLGAGVIIVYNGIAGIIIFSILKKINLFRTSAECEMVGLDWFYSREPAYPTGAYNITSRDLKSDSEIITQQTHEYQHQPSQFLPPVQQSDNLFTPDSVNIDDDIFLIQSNMEIEC